MFSSLVESESKQVRRPGGTILSFLAHYGLILGVIYTSAQAKTVGDTPRVEEITYVATKEPVVKHDPPPPDIVAPRPVKTSPLLIAPVDVPSVLPEIDLSHAPTDANSFIRPRPAVTAGPGAGVVEDSVDATATYVISEVERPATHKPNSAAPAYPDILRPAGVEGYALVSFVVDTSGRVDLTTFKVIRSTHELFTSAVKNALPRMRFFPAEVGERKVRQLVQQPYSFAIVK